MSLACRWQQALGTFTHALSRTCGEHIFRPAAPVDLRAAVGLPVATSVWRRGVDPVLEFYAAADDPPRLRLGVLPIGATAWLACVRWRGTAPFAIAAGRHEGTVQAFVWTLITSNGSVFGLEAFAEPPTRACNHRPDLVSCDIVAQAMQAQVARPRGRGPRVAVVAPEIMCRGVPLPSWCVDRAAQRRRASSVALGARTDTPCDRSETR